MDDADVLAIRRAWAPVFADIDVDIVLQGHDHIYSRTFVNRFGENVKQQNNERLANVPLYLTGGHAGGLKWYSLQDYQDTDNDLIENYDENFFDNISYDEDGNKLKEQMYSEITVDDNSLTVASYAFKYDADSDKITTAPYLFDTVTLTK